MLHEHQDLLIVGSKNPSKKTRKSPPPKTPQTNKTSTAFPFKENKGETTSWALAAFSYQGLNYCAFLYDHHGVLTLKADL